MAQQSVSGKVTDANTEEALPGVNIIVKGTSRGTATDLDGSFKLNVHSLNDTLMVSYLGYETMAVPIDGRTTINISLRQQTLTGEEVVVVGYGQQQKSDVTGSIASVSAKDVSEVPVANVSQALQGRTAGVQVQQTSTRPGQTAQIRIRGTRSLTASNNPLIVVDDVPFEGSLNDLNTNNIQSIEVLKDASATAIYGSRGANGVILVTTKQGRSGKPQITYNAYQGINTVARRYQVFDAQEFINMRNLSGYQPYTNRELESMRTGNYTDWQDQMYDNGTISNQQLNVSGGTATTRYSFGGGYYDETAVTPGQEFQRYSLHMNISQDIGDRIKVGLKSNNSYNITEGESASFMYPILTTTPLDPAYDSTGAIVQIPGYPNENQYSPLLLNKKNTWTEQRKRIATYNSIFGELNILEGLKYRINVGLNYRHDQYGNFYASDTPFNNGGQSTARVDNGVSYDYTIQNLLYYKKTLAKKHELDATALYSIHQSQTNNTDLRAMDMVANFSQYYNLGLSNSTPTVPANDQGYAKRGLISYMGRINYTYDDRYLITLTGRVDGSSVLAEDKQWNAYPAVAVAWRVINEKFMKNQDFITNLKLRASYGETSNQAVNPYQTLGSLTQNLYNFGSNNAYGYYVSNLPNQNLGWEYTKSYNAGIDFGFLNSRIKGSVEVYKQHTFDILLNQNLPPTSGVPGAFLTNVGETENKGLEVQLTTINSMKTNGLFWSTDFNFSLNRNKILKLNSGVQQDIGNGWFVDQPINVIYDYQKVGIWQLDEAAEAAKYGMKPGQIHVADLNNDGQITGDDRTILGSLDPDFEFGITNRFNYKGFDLSIVAFARVGGKLISTLHQPQSYLNMLSGRRNGVKVNYWTPTNPTNDYPMPSASRGDNPVYGSTLGYFDASFLNIRSIDLGYTLPDKWVKAFGGQSVRIYANVKNVATLFSPYIDEGGVSPQPTGYGYQGVGTSNIPGRQLTVGANTPPVRTFSLGINITY